MQDHAVRRCLGVYGLELVSNLDAPGLRSRASPQRQSLRSHATSTSANAFNDQISSSEGHLRSRRERIAGLPARQCCAAAVPGISQAESSGRRRTTTSVRSARRGSISVHAVTTPTAPSFVVTPDFEVAATFSTEDDSQRAEDCSRHHARRQPAQSGPASSTAFRTAPISSTILVIEFRVLSTRRMQRRPVNPPEHTLATAN
jgi:hypothetical protein